MGRIDVIAGTELIEINKKKEKIILRFENQDTKSIYTLLFDGWLFETSVPAVGLRVLNVSLNNSIGFRALNQLRRVNQDAAQYRQLFIQMKNETEDKAELIAVSKHYRLQKKPANLFNSQSGGAPARN